MAAYDIRGLTFTYPGQASAALQGVSLSLEQGEFVTLCGPAGCGKTTLLRQLKPLCAPRGMREGELWLDGRRLESLDRREQAARIGLVQQSAQEQTVTDKVWHELAFGLESLGCEPAVIRRRVAEMAAFFGMEEWFHRSVDQLSGGQRQLLNLAAVLVMQPDILLLDEPTSQLDPIGAEEFLAALGKVNRELGTTVLLSAHRLDAALPLSHRVLVMEAGRIVADAPPQAVAASLQAAGSGMAAALPTPMRLWAAVGGWGECPVTVSEGGKWLGDYVAAHGCGPLPLQTSHSYLNGPVLTAEALWFRYEKEEPEVIKGLSLQVHAGEFLAILGGNGGGKTTALKLLAGLRRPQRGAVVRRGRLALLPQDPRALFVKKTVGEELSDMAGDGAAREAVIALCRLEGLLERHPYDLSGGEQQRAALAKVLLTRPEILLLDEPTKGLDVAFREELAGILRQLLAQGVAVVMASHDLTFCAGHAHRCVLLFDGKSVADGTPRAFFSGNRFYTTPANRMARKTAPQAVTVEELMVVCGGSVPPVASGPPVVLPGEDAPAPAAERQPEETVGCARRNRLAVALVLLLIPATLLVGTVAVDGGGQYALSLLILLECMLPVFLSFEGRRPQARELVLLAVLCALGVAGRGAFFLLPQVKPVLALTVVVGAGLGRERGFLVGAMTMLVSNMLFGQGPWTPWQMFAMGLTGFLAGMLFHGGRVRPTRGRLCLFGGVAAVAVYGVLLNTASALLVGGTWNGKLLAAFLLSGLPLDCVHGAATVAFLWLAARPLLEKLERIRVKYGMDDERKTAIG